MTKHWFKAAGIRADEAVDVERRALDAYKYCRTSGS